MLGKERNDAYGGRDISRKRKWGRGSAADYPGPARTFRRLSLPMKVRGTASVLMARTHRGVAARAVLDRLDRAGARVGRRRSPCGAATLQDRVGNHAGRQPE